jgi:hypothetical protein
MRRGCLVDMTYCHIGLSPREDGALAFYVGGAASRVRNGMLIQKHDKSYVVELSDGSGWRIWPGDLAATLNWRSTTNIDVVEIQDEISIYALVDRERGLSVHVIGSSSHWPLEAMQHLAHG